MSKYINRWTIGITLGIWGQWYMERRQDRKLAEFVIEHTNQIAEKSDSQK